MGVKPGGTAGGREKERNILFTPSHPGRENFCVDIRSHKWNLWAIRMPSLSGRLFRRFIFPSIHGILRIFWQGTSHDMIKMYCKKFRVLSTGYTFPKDSFGNKRSDVFFK